MALISDKLKLTLGSVVCTLSSLYIVTAELDLGICKSLHAFQLPVLSFIPPVLMTGVTGQYETYCDSLGENIIQNDICLNIRLFKLKLQWPKHSFQWVSNIQIFTGNTSQSQEHDQSENQRFQTKWTCEWLLFIYLFIFCCPLLVEACCFSPVWSSHYHIATECPFLTQSELFRQNIF